MNRRAFLAALIAGATLDPEKLLWVPGKKLISIPPPRQWVVDLMQQRISEALAQMRQEGLFALWRDGEWRTLPDNFRFPAQPNSRSNCAAYSLANSRSISLTSASARLLRGSGATPSSLRAGSGIGT